MTIDKSETIRARNSVLDTVPGFAARTDESLPGSEGPKNSASFPEFDLSESEPLRSPEILSRFPSKSCHGITLLTLIYVLFLDQMFPTTTAGFPSSEHEIVRLPTLDRQ